ncbi:hypothetical protein F4809DRAFT_643622 [Biscogniauxia mediterranea]|nr:hypothetical protein F4809DRAFT_643622 [Biscogniauxia mediterranea]
MTQFLVLGYLILIRWFSDDDGKRTASLDVTSDIISECHPLQCPLLTSFLHSFSPNLIKIYRHLTGHEHMTPLSKMRIGLVVGDSLPHSGQLPNIRCLCSPTFGRTLAPPRGAIAMQMTGLDRSNSCVVQLRYRFRHGRQARGHVIRQQLF